MFANLLPWISLGRPSASRNLTLTPILQMNSPLSPLESISLEEALAAGTLRVTKVSAEGHVPELPAFAAGGRVLNPEIRRTRPRP